MKIWGTDESDMMKNLYNSLIWLTVYIRLCWDKHITAYPFKLDVNIFMKSI